MASLLYKWLLLSFSWFTLFPLTGPGASPAAHPFYVSVTEINHNSADKTLEISCKMFADDIEQTLEKNYKVALDITRESDKASFDKYLFDYFSKNLAITLDGKPAKLSYVGYEQEKESAYCYLQVEGVSSVKKLDISNGVLYDFNETEVNIMHVTVSGTRKSTKVQYPEKTASFTF